MAEPSINKGCFWYIVAFFGALLLIVEDPAKAWSLIKQLFTELFSRGDRNGTKGV